jgi:hypothetical protein
MSLSAYSEWVTWPLWPSADWVVKPRKLALWRCGNEARDRPRLTPKGERTRSRIVEAAAQLIYERGVAGTVADVLVLHAPRPGGQVTSLIWLVLGAPRTGAADLPERVMWPRSRGRNVDGGVDAGPDEVSR